MAVKGVEFLSQAELRKEWAEKFYTYLLVEKNGSRLTGENYRRDISDFEQFMAAKAGADFNWNEVQVIHMERTLTGMRFRSFISVPILPGSIMRTTQDEPLPDGFHPCVLSTSFYCGKSTLVRIHLPRSVRRNWTKGCRFFWKKRKSIPCWTCQMLHR